MMKRSAIFLCAMLLSLVPVSSIKSETGGIRTAANGIEGPEWQLVEVSGSPVSPLAGEKQPHIIFDPSKKQVTGFAGCNNFFGSYDLDGSALKFGPVGASRMFCEGEAGEVELKLMQALEQTRSWEIRDGALLLIKDREVLARFTSARGDSAAVDLNSMTFLSRWIPSGKATLSNGAYREPAAPGSATETVIRLGDKRVFGKVHGRETGAVVLVTDPGGSGTFRDLALLTKEVEGWVNTDTVLLGDRVEVQSVAISGDTVVVMMKTHGPLDPMCCPSSEVVKGFAVKENRLVPLPGKASEKTTQKITGTVWHWVQTLYNDDRKAVPADPKNYTVEFREDGTVNAKADCNMKGGTYTYSPEEKRLSMEITHSTMAACPEGSLEDEFVRGLSGAAIYFIRDGDLYIDLKYDSGTMQFSK